MRFFFPELTGGISLKREEQRLDNIQFASERPCVKPRW